MTHRHLDTAALEQKLKSWTEYIQRCPDDAMGWAQRANANAFLQNPDAGLADADEALRLDPENGFALQCRAVCKAKANEYDGAVADLSKALKTEYAELNRGGMLSHRARIVSLVNTVCDVL